MKRLLCFGQNSPCPTGGSRTSSTRSNVNRAKWIPLRGHGRRHRRDAVRLSEASALRCPPSDCSSQGSPWTSRLVHGCWPRCIEPPPPAENIGDVVYTRLPVTSQRKLFGPHHDRGRVQCSRGFARQHRRPRDASCYRVCLRRRTDGGTAAVPQMHVNWCSLIRE